MRSHVEQVGTVERHRAVRHVISGAPAEHVGQCRLARAVRSHDRMDFARIERKRKTLQDLRPADHRVEVVDLEHCQPFLPVMREYRLLMRSTGVPSESGTAFATE